MDTDSLREQIAAIAQEPGSRTQRAERIAGALRRAGKYRWVGLYDVIEQEIAVIAWSGPSAPTHPRFSRSQGLCRAAAAAGRTVIANDIRTDPRYLNTLQSTRAEMIVPVRLGPSGQVVGLVDVESDRINAFSDTDRELCESFAEVLKPLWRLEGEATK